MLVKNHNAEIVSQIKSVKANEDGDLIIEGYANTVSKDRAGDVIPKSAWETKNALTNYMKNPIILAYHNHSMPIGKMIGYEVTEMGLKIQALISKGAGDVYHLIKDGILSTFSVGFGILDAEYDSKSDTYYINDVELHEVSVVSVPCNQDSTFSVAKSMKSNEDFEKFKSTITPEDTGDTKEIKTMNPEEVKALLASMQAEQNASVSDAVTIAVKAAEDAKEAKALKLKEASDAATAFKATTAATAKEAASELVKELKVELAEKDGNFAEMVKMNSEKLVSLKEEIAQVVASRNNPVNQITKAITGDFNSSREKDVSALVMLGVIKNVPMLETDFGKRFASQEKAVNGSSSIAVSSDGYETEFSTNLMRDIQSKLVVAPLFTEIQMNQANLTIPINPGRSNANWVSAGNLADRTAVDRTGAEITATLTEKTLTTFKLAAKTFLTEETQEDAIISLIPLLRDHLVEAHAAEMDRAFLIGTGTGQPKGLVTQAEAVAASAQTVVTAAKADGSVLVTAAGILAARRKMGLYGIDVKNCLVLLSQDAYWDLIQDSEWADVQQVGDANATKLVGEVGNVYGMRVMVADQFATKAVSTAYGCIVNASNFIVARQRGMTLKSDFDIELDTTVFVATQRVNLESRIDDGSGNGKGVVSLQYAAA